MANPSFQIDNYLRATPPKWAILTNGRLWRLYHEDTSVKMDCYYEVNLPELIGWRSDWRISSISISSSGWKLFPEVPPAHLSWIESGKRAWHTPRRLEAICKRMSIKQ